MTERLDPSKPRVRFAPSPTGYLHIGGVRTALFNWLWARKLGGTFVLRIEDTDQERSTAESRAVIVDSLNWLGLDWDEGPDVGGPHGPYTQMERLALYKEVADRLVEEGKAYRCYATKEELDAAREALKKENPKAAFRYPGWWRDKTSKDWPADKPYVIRFKAKTEGVTTYDDLVFGTVSTPNSAQQDFVLLRSDGIPLYNFGCTVDDHAMGITLVARGRDHMVNTPPQLMLYEALGAKPPQFAHLPMMLAPNGEKLSKRHGAVSVTEYRDKGYSPHAVLNYLSRFGWSYDGEREVFSRQELIDLFSWERCGKGDGKFDEKKFLAIEHEHLKSPQLTPDDEYTDRLLPFLRARELPGIDGKGVEREHVKRAIYTIRERSRTFVEAADGLDFFFRNAPVVDEAATRKFLTKAAAPHLAALAELLSAVNPWEEKELETRVHDWLAAKGLQIKDVAQPARVALTGRAQSPGLYQVLYILGRDPSLARLRAGAEKAATSAT